MEHRNISSINNMCLGWQRTNQNVNFYNQIRKNLQPRLQDKQPSAVCAFLNNREMLERDAMNHRKVPIHPLSKPKGDWLPTKGVLS